MSCYTAKCKNCDHQGKEKIYPGETAQNLLCQKKGALKCTQQKGQTKLYFDHIEKEHAGVSKNVEFEWKGT